MVEKLTSIKLIPKSASLFTLSSSQSDDIESQRRRNIINQEYFQYDNKKASKMIYYNKFKEADVFLSKKVIRGFSFFFNLIQNDLNLKSKKESLLLGEKKI